MYGQDRLIYSREQRKLFLILINNTVHGYPIYMQVIRNKRLEREFVAGRTIVVGHDEIKVLMYMKHKEAQPSRTQSIPILIFFEATGLPVLVHSLGLCLVDLCGLEGPLARITCEGRASQRK